MDHFFYSQIYKIFLDNIDSLHRLSLEINQMASAEIDYEIVGSEKIKKSIFRKDIFGKIN